MFKTRVLDFALGAVDGSCWSSGVVKIRRARAHVRVGKNGNRGGAIVRRPSATSSPATVWCACAPTRAPASCRQHHAGERRRRRVAHAHWQFPHVPRHLPLLGNCHLILYILPLYLYSSCPRTLVSTRNRVSYRSVRFAAVGDFHSIHVERDARRTNAFLDIFDENVFSSKTHGYRRRRRHFTPAYLPPLRRLVVAAAANAARTHAHAHVHTHV